MQTVVKQGSLVTGGVATDFVDASLYDEYGRESFKYLPFASTGADGLFKMNPFSQQASFYSGTDANKNPIKGQGETWFYSHTRYEASPLNRVEETFAPGNSWAGTSGSSTESARKSVKTKYYINTAVDAVRIWNVANATPGSFGSYASPGAYPAGELYKNISVDENNRQAIEFKDREGKVIFKKMQFTAAADNGSGSSHTGWLCTYYIYDDLGNLRCVIQPRGVELISSGWVLTDGALLDGQCFRYEYDHRQRLIMKKVPGAGVVNMVYDKRDRLVMMQDAKMAASPVKWLVTKYDGLNRAVETGLWTNSTSAQAHRNNAANLTGDLYEYPKSAAPMKCSVKPITTIMTVCLRRLPLY